MALNQQQQFFELINQAERVLICFNPESVGGGYAADEPAAALALAKMLISMGKKATIVAENFTWSERLAFLKSSQEIESGLKNLRHFLLDVNLSGKKINEFSYDVKDNHLLIYLLPDQGDIKAEEVQVKGESFRFDLIIVLGAPDLEMLGHVFQEHKEFFFQTPVINIDIDPANENFGQLNLINLTACAVTEIIYELIHAVNPMLIDAPMATGLLAGMIDKTESFKKSNLIPQSLYVVADLINRGAERDKIITYFYRTKNLTTLKLWGRVLARLQADRSLGLAWTAVPGSDFIKTGTIPLQINGVMEELISKSPFIKIGLVLYEKNNTTIGVQLWSAVGLARKLAENWSAQGDKNFVNFEIANKNLAMVEQEVISEIRRKMEILSLNR